MKDDMIIAGQLAERGMPTLLAEQHPQISQNASHYINCHSKSKGLSVLLWNTSDLNNLRTMTLNDIHRTYKMPRYFDCSLVDMCTKELLIYISGKHILQLYYPLL